MSYAWYKVINRAEFLSTGLVSRSVDVILEGVGQASILVTNGNFISITYDGVILPVGMFGRNPYTFQNKAVFVDSDEDVWLGIAS